MKSSIPRPEGRSLSGSRNRPIKIALAGRVKEFPAESRYRNWLRQISKIAEVPVYGGEYALYLGRRRAFAIASAAVALAVLLAFFPHLRSLLWPVIAWGLLLFSAIIVLGVGISILVALASMYTGYPANTDVGARPVPATALRSEIAPLEKRPNVVSQPANRWADVLNNLRSAEYALSNLESSFASEVFSGDQKRQHDRVLRELQMLIREVSNGASPHRIAS